MDEEECQKKFFTNGRFDDRKFLLSQYAWRGDRTNCVKQRPKKGEKAGVTGYKAFGVITSLGPPVTVYLRDMSREEGDFKQTKQYDSVDALLADGWIID